jgi:hypothetical protein
MKVLTAIGLMVIQLSHMRLSTFGINMEELLIVIIQFLFEFMLDVISNIPFDWTSSERTTPEPEGISLRCFLGFCGGCLLAGVSLLVVKHTVISVSALRITNVALAPIASAFLSQAIASRRARANVFIVPRNHFWQAFWFTLGLVLIRFAYASRV